MRMTDDQQNHILHYRIVDPCDGTDIKYEGRTGSISDHFGVLQYFTDHGDEFRKYNDGALLRFCCGRTDPAFYQGQKKRKDGRGSTGACEPDEPKAGFPYGCFTDPAEYDIYPVFKSFAKVIPDFSEGEADGKQYAVRFAVLILALILTGIGAAMSLNMRIIPNPGDGIVQAIADCIHKSVGFTKNCFDVFNVTVTICISLLCRGHLIGIGIGTVCAVIGVGRTIAVFNHFTKEKMTELAGIEI